ncbi:hypothetical protein MTsPCn5_09740 [Croceitalea sp. MTPC5]|nr:hypothetical protein MTsPCn5_09740 [Croceitalea sp. MTPC5]
MELAIGIILGFATVILAKVTGFSRDRGFYPLLLIVIALYYVLFAFQYAVNTAILLEVGIALIFSVLAFIGHKRSLIIVAAGLALHGIYDLLHSAIPYTTEAPDWWAMFCLGFDVVLAIGLLLAIRWYKYQNNKSQYHERNES